MAISDQSPVTTALTKSQELVPTLRARAAEVEQLREVPKDLMDAVAETGVIRMMVPPEYGGIEANLEDVHEILATIGLGDGSVAWVAAVLTAITWAAGLFPDAAQDQIFANPDVRVCGVVAPTGRTERKGDGYIVSGKWPFVSGCRNADWAILGSIIDYPDSGPSPAFVLIPVRDLEIQDDWDVSGLQGTGSSSVTTEGTFVHEDFTMNLVKGLQDVYPCRRHQDHWLYRAPLSAMLQALSIGAIVGNARHGVELFRDRLGKRPLTYTSYEKASEAPVNHLRLSEALLKIDSGELLGRQLFQDIDRAARTGQRLDVEARARSRAVGGYATYLCREAILMLNSGSGASSIYRATSAMQRIVRDQETFSLHSLLNASTGHELYGRVLCGMEPNTIVL